MGFAGDVWSLTDSQYVYSLWIQVSRVLRNYLGCDCGVFCTFSGSNWLVVVFDGIINIMALLMFDYYYCVISITPHLLHCYLLFYIVIYIHVYYWSSIMNVITPVPHLGFTAVVAESGPM